MKPWYASKTILTNLFALIGAVAVSLGLDLGLTAEVQGTLVVGILAAVNVVLRAVTKKAIVPVRDDNPHNYPE